MHDCSRYGKLKYFSTICKASVFHIAHFKHRGLSVCVLELQMNDFKMIIYLSRSELICVEANHSIPTRLVLVLVCGPSNTRLVGTTRSSCLILNI